MSDLNLLKNKKIINLFIGDTPVKNDFIQEQRMPYMKGFQICDFSKKIGLEQNYNEAKLSRWKYMKNTINYVVENNKINCFFKELLEIKRFEELADDYDCIFISSIQEKYWNIVNNLFQ